MELGGRNSFSPQMLNLHVLLPSVHTGLGLQGAKVFL